MAARQKTGDNKATDQNESQLVSSLYSFEAIKQTQTTFELISFMRMLSDWLDVPKVLASEATQAHMEAHSLHSFRG